MKILIAYDGSKDADAAMDDLRCSGLPATGTAEVISVAEVWLPPEGSLEYDTGAEASEYIEDVLRECRAKGEKAVAEAEMLARFAHGRVKTALPAWDVTSLATYGSPGWEIVGEAQKIDADLIVVGAQGRSFLSRMVLGSISQQVLTEAHCSVRIGRGRIDLDSGPARIVIGFDGSRGAWAAVESVASRDWKTGSEVSLVAVNEPVVSNMIGRFVTPIERTVNEVDTVERTWVERSAKDAIVKLRERGLDASFRIQAGNPKTVLPEAAEKWSADCIFVGANAWGSRLARLLIGSTSAAVAARAYCSVEVVRMKNVESET